MALLESGAQCARARDRGAHDARERAEFQRMSGLAGAVFSVVIAGGMAIVIPMLVFWEVVTVGRIVPTPCIW